MNKRFLMIVAVAATVFVSQISTSEACHRRKKARHASRHHQVAAPIYTQPCCVSGPMYQSVAPY